MQKDLDKSIQPKDTYLNAENFRIVASTGSSTGSLENILGNSLLLTITGSILGHCFVRNDLIIFSSYQSGTIYKAVLDDFNNVVSLDIIWSHATSGSYLLLSTTRHIKAVGRYESDTIKKVYFTDGYNNVRFFNYADPNFSTTSVEEFEFLRKGYLNTPELDKISKGNLLSGEVQYVYKLYDLHGAETLFSDMSPLYHISEADEGSSDSKYHGSDVNKDTGKSYLIKIEPNSDFSKFDKLELVALHYNTLNGEPTIRILERVSLSSSLDNIYVLDYGQSIGTYSIDEITIMNTGDFTATDLNTKNNYLFASNITEKYFDVDTWDARAYRWTGQSTAADIVLSYLYDDSSHRIMLTYNKVSKEKVTQFQKLSGASWVEDTTNKYGVASTSTGWNVPDEHNCINYLNDTSRDTDFYLPDDYNSCKYQVTQETLGGEGVNVSYRFTTKVNTADGNVEESSTFTSAHSEGDVILNSNSSVYSYASPHYDAFRSFQRDEIYRFNIVLKDNKGRESFPKWIGDIRCPSIRDYNGYMIYPTSTKIKEGETYRIVGNSGNTITYNSGSLSVGDTFVGVAGQTSYTLLSGYGTRVILDRGSIVTYTIGGVNHYDFSVFHNEVDPNTGKTILKYKILSVSFKVSNLPSTVDSFKITVAERQEKDKTILSQGLISRCFSYNDQYYVANTWPTCNKLKTKWTNYDNVLWNFISPEISFNNAVSYKTGDVLFPQAFCGMIPISLQTDSHTYTGDMGIGIPRYSVHKAKSVTNVDIYVENSRGSQPMPISESKIVTPSLSDNITLSTFTYQNRSYWNHDGSTNNASLYCKNLLIALTGSSLVYIPESNTSATESFICNYKRVIFDSQYGGYTYSARQNSKSITCSPSYKRGTTGYTITTYGDTYIGLFDATLSMYDSEISASRITYQAVYIPVETTINLYLRQDDSTCKLAGNTDVIYIKEVSGKHYKGEGDTTKDSSYYDQKYDLYKYNSVYSRRSSSKLFSPKPVDWEEQRKFDNRVKYSDLKINSEEIDSWTKFRTSNYKEVDSAYGQVNNLQVFNNNLYFWQENAFGVLAVNPRSIIRDNDNLELTLGTGSVLDRYDYISTKGGGNMYTFGIATSQYGIYWLDGVSKEIYKFTSSGVESLSKLKNIRSYINSLEYIYDVKSVYDSKNNEILFTITKQYYKTITSVSSSMGTNVITVANSDLNVTVGDNVYLGTIIGTVIAITPTLITIRYSSGTTPNVNDKIYIRDNNCINTLVFSEYSDSFTSFYTIKPSYYIEVNYNILSTEDLSNIYIHNSGNRGSFYGTTYDSTLKLIVNPDFSYTKTFDNLSFFSSSLNSNINIIYDTWNEVRIYNDYQNTDYIRLVPGDTDSLVRRERGWTMQIPRNKVTEDVLNNPNIFDDINLSDSKEYSERIRDKYIVIDFIYENTNNYTFNIPYIITDYRYSIR